MTDRRRPENSALRKQWVKLTAYAEMYDVDPRTVLKWADAGLVDMRRIQIPGQRATIRVLNQPPLDSAPDARVPPRSVPTS